MHTIIFLSYRGIPAQIKPIMYWVPIIHLQRQIGILTDTSPDSNCIHQPCTYSWPHSQAIYRWLAYGLAQLTHMYVTLHTVKQPTLILADGMGTKRNTHT